MRGSRVKRLRRERQVVNPGRKHGGSVREPSHVFPLKLKLAVHSHEREDARRRRQARRDAIRSAR